MAELISLLKTENYLRKSKLRLKRIRKADLVSIDDMMLIVIETNEVILDSFLHRCEVINMDGES